MQVPSFKSAGEDYSLKEMTKSTKKSAVSCPWKNACAANVRAFLSVYFPTESVGGKKVTKVKKKITRVPVKGKSLNIFGPLSPKLA